MRDGKSLRLKQWELLRQLAVGGQSVSEIAAALDRKPGPVTAALRTLMAQGLVQVSSVSDHSAPGHPRGVWSLTERGREQAEPGAGLGGLGAARAPGADPSQRRAAWILEAHQSFVSAAVESSAIPELLEPLARGQHAAEDGAARRRQLRPRRLPLRPVQH